MKLIKTKNYSELSKKAYAIIEEEISKKPNLSIAFATGKTPLGLYDLIVRSHQRGELDFSKIKAFNLDEYYPIKKEDKQSFYYCLHKNLFDKINIKQENIVLLNGEAKTLLKECENYEKVLEKTPIDLMILGVGENSHIAFNEPGSSFDSKTRLVHLTPETIKINSSFFKKVPDNALTIGISTILSSRKIILLASGKKKAKAMKNLIEGKITSNYPVTGLRKHKNLTVIIDKKAGSLLQKN